MKVFLDDIRQPSECVSYMYQRIGALNPIYLEDWAVVRNYDEFKAIIEDNIDKITHVSFDHDLADSHYTPEEYWDDYEESKKYQESLTHTEKTGYECAVWMKEFYEQKGIELPIMFVHSMNPVGTDKIVNLFKQ